MTVTINLGIIDFMRKYQAHIPAIQQALKQNEYPSDLPAKFRPNWWNKKDIQTLQRKLMWCQTVLKWCDSI